MLLPFSKQSRGGKQLVCECAAKTTLTVYGETAPRKPATKDNTSQRETKRR